MVMDLQSNPRKRHFLVAWSGGYDSTSVIETIFQEHGRFCEVTAVVIQSDNINSNQYKLESLNRDAYLGYCVERGYKLEVHEQRMNIVGEPVVKGVGQPMLWISFMSMLYDPEKHESIQFGYIAGDDFWRYAHNFEQAIINVCAIAGKPAPKIEYPLGHHRKEDVIRYVRKHDIQDFVSTCETPTDELMECGHCVSCKKLKSALANVDVKIDVDPMLDLVSRLRFRSVNEVAFGSGSDTNTDIVDNGSGANFSLRLAD